MIPVVVAALVVELAIGVVIGYALASSRDERPRRGRVEKHIEYVDALERIT